MAYEKLMSKYPQLTIKEVTLPRGLSGLYYDNVIKIDKHKSKYEKHSILAEEIGHYETTYGDIIDQTNIKNRKLELVARRWAYEKLVSLNKLIDCHNNHITTVSEVCTHL